ncbi:MAG: tetratricopeptide repeat protein [Longimicrobiaceae bacterium]
MPSFSRATRLAAAALLAAAPLAAQHDDHAHGASPLAATDIARLGRVEFANSGAPAAQPAFLRGMTLLHSFLFSEARSAFREAETADPGFAMAYWGEMLSAGDSAAVDSILRRLGPTPAARAAKAPTARERDYLSIAERFLLTSSDDDSVTVAYADAWRALHERYPDDDDATLFYALALVSRRFTEQADANRSLRTAVEAGALIEDVFRRRPEHPGAAHYLIHAYDDARLAPLGLRAARVYARIAPAAHHAVHMPSHIFFQFGMWDDVVAANERGWALSKASTGGGELPPEEWDYHALDWLHFGYLQQGRLRRARVLADSVRAIWTPARVAAAPEYRRGFLSRLAATFDARDALETGRYPAAVDPAALVSPNDLLAAALGAASRRDLAAIDAVRRRMEAVNDSMGKGNASSVGPAQRAAVLRIRAVRAQAAGHADSAVALLRMAADSVELDPALFLAEGPQRSSVGITHLLLARALVEGGHLAEALAAYDRALELSPGRSAAVLGRARVLARLGRREEAQRAYAQLMASWKDADADLPDLAEARAGAAATGHASP